MQGYAATINDRQDRIVQELNSRADWFEKYEYLIGLGKSLPIWPDESKTDRHAMKGCQSRVWIRAEMSDGVLHFSADSDSQITRGMIALLVSVLDGTSPSEAAGADLYFVEKTGLGRNLSPARANGLKTIINHMQGLAREHI
ncbi:MAG: SufE family protein [Phycisphaerae bacterium]